MTQTNQNIFEELGFSAEESENLRVRLPTARYANGFND
jgi:hypothetical protein